MRNYYAALTAKQLRWIDEYMVDFNGAAAAVRAGYSRKCARSIAHENTTKPDIQVVLQEKQAAIAKEMLITRQGVIKGLLEAVEMGRELQNPMSMISALREIAKILGFNTAKLKRVVLSLDGQVKNSRLNQLSDAQLHNIITAGHASVL